jgi:protein involved in polysaccharide export with SLBB domain
LAARAFSFHCCCRWSATAQDAATTNGNVATELLQPPPTTNALVATTTVNSAYPRAPWQQKFTIGPGDVLKISLYGQPEVTRPEVIVGPDGRIGFLEAQDVMATGLTIDELRVSLDKVLGEFRRAPRTMISPVTLKSKKYAVLGKVVPARGLLNRSSHNDARSHCERERI